MDASKLSSISKADTDEKIGEFWDTHDFTDFDTDAPDVEFEIAYTVPLEEEAKALESKSVEELYEILGRQLLSKTLGASKFSDEDRKEEAKDWEKEHELDLRRAVCTSRVYQAYVEDPSGWEWVVIVVSLADAVAAVAVGVSPLTVAALILKKGLDKFCTNNQP